MENLNGDNEKEDKMVKRKSREGINFVSLIIGIILIITGLGGSAITLPTGNSIIIFPVILLIVGLILALMGGLRKW